MKKAILVVDKPESCTSCLLGIYHKRWFCLKTLKDIDITDRHHIPTWCPLKPMPEKETRNVMEGTPCEEWQSLYDEGWNDCIEEVERNAWQKNE